MSRAMLSALVRRLRAERGQTSVEYVGVFLVACAIVAVLLNAGIGELLAAKLKAQIVAVSTDQESGGGGSSKGGDSSGGSGGSSDGGSGGAGGGSGSGDEGGGPGQPPGAGGEGPPGAGSKPGVPGGGSGSSPGGPNQPPGATEGATPPGTPPDPARAKDGEALPCLGGPASYQKCVDKALQVPTYFAKGRVDAARERLVKSQRKILRSGARPGTAEFDRLVAKREAARDYYEQAKKTAKNPLLRAARRAKQVVGTTPGDLQELREARRGAGEKAVPERQQAARANLSSGAPKTKSAARKFLDSGKKHGAKLLKGTGIVGTAVGAYDNFSKDGVRKGGTKTAGMVAGGYAGGAAMAAGCAALAVTGVGAVVCGGLVLGATVVGSEAGKYLAGEAYDKVLAPVGRAARDAGKAYYENVTKPAAKVVAKGAEAAVDGAKKVGAALNPFD